MAISEQITANAEQLVQEFVEFARSQPRHGLRRLDQTELEDSVRQLLGALAEDLRGARSGREQPDKTQPHEPADTAAIRAFAERHALTRLRQGFRLDQLVTEYRALRASVVRLADGGHRPPDLGELLRFHEAVDEAMSSSVSLYVAEVERARELFIGILGHDLRNPLNAVVLSAEVLLCDERLGSTSMGAAVRVRNSAARMSRMIEDLIDFARTRLGTRLPTSPTRVELGTVLAQTIDELRIAHPARELVYEPPPPIWGQWDSARIGQLFSNLIGNAIQHGEPTRPVTIGMRTEGADVIVDIHNHGPAIAPEALDKIFEPLMRMMVQEAERRSGRPSVGLGLYIAREIVRAHGGRIAVDSSPERGTTFTVRLRREN